MEVKQVSLETYLNLASETWVGGTEWHEHKYIMHLALDFALNRKGHLSATKRTSQISCAKMKTCSAPLKPSNRAEVWQRGCFGRFSVVLQMFAQWRNELKNIVAI